MRKVPHRTWKVSSDGWQGKYVSPEDAAKIETVIQLTCAFDNVGTGIFHKEILKACEEVGWPVEHPMALWTGALYANVFPVLYHEDDVRDTEGLIHFTEPGFALEHSKLGLFWNDRDLVCLALKRSADHAPHRAQFSRPGLNPYECPKPGKSSRIRQS